MRHIAEHPIARSRRDKIDAIHRMLLFKLLDSRLQIVPVHSYRERDEMLVLIEMGPRFSGDFKQILDSPFNEAASPVVLSKDEPQAWGRLHCHMYSRALSLIDA
jgi:hypothetical protein